MHLATSRCRFSVASIRVLRVVAAPVADSVLRGGHDHRP
jgi:hypothetical protein